MREPIELAKNGQSGIWNWFHKLQKLKNFPQPKRVLQRMVAIIREDKLIISTNIFYH